jgi:hypothetical protein
MAIKVCKTSNDTVVWDLGGEDDNIGGSGKKLASEHWV